MPQVIQFRRGTAAEWAAKNPVLNAGEPGYETDTGQYKIGDGQTAWSDLPAYVTEEGLADRLDGLLSGAAQTPEGVVIDVRAAFGAVGDGIVDDTEAIRAALAATPSGGTCYLPPGTYLLGGVVGAAALVVPDGVTLRGAGRALSVLRTSLLSTATRLVDVSRAKDVRIADLGFDGQAHATTLSAVYASARGTVKNLTVERCRFSSFMPGNATTTHAAVYTWTSDGVRVHDNDFVDCGRAITIDQPDGSASVVGNRIEATTAGLMSTGITVRRSSAVSSGQVLVQGNTVRGANRDPGGYGAEGHGITTYRCQDVHIIGNHCTGNGRGILVSQGSFGAVVQGNTCTGNSDAGIRCEPEISAKDTSVGAGAARGVTIMGNVCRDNAAIGTPKGANTGLGITVSYAAGSVVSGNLVHDNTGDGIHCDSDRVSVVGNIAYNNFKGYTSDPVNGRRAGIRIYAGTGCVVVGNQAFDNQATPTQQYGLSLSSGGTWHTVHGNDFAGNAAGEIWGADHIKAGFFGSAPVARPASPAPATGTDAETINGIIDRLKDLGLFS